MSACRKGKNEGCNFLNGVGRRQGEMSVALITKHLCNQQQSLAALAVVLSVLLFC
jgi:hypothetical protein